MANGGTVASTMRTVLVSLLVLASAAVPAAAQAGTARFVVDLRALNALGPRHITANATAPADAFLRDGKAYVVMPVARSGKTVALRGGLVFAGSGKRTEFKSIAFRGTTLTGSYGGHRFSIVKFSNVQRSAKAITTGSGALASQAANLLRTKFHDNVFRSGLGFFASGRIPL
jgi:hypothetical protein